MMLFNFKQFQVDQSGCAMKINTDGVLLGALARNVDPVNVLDIGTGTGVIALMMAQRFKKAIIDAVEIDGSAAQTAKKNFSHSDFRDRLNIYCTGFDEYFETYPGRVYDLIITNPPFYINSLEAATAKTNLAKHTDGFFFNKLIQRMAGHITTVGLCWLILPVPTAAMVKELALQNGLFLQQVITVHSFAGSNAHREIIALGLSQTKNTQQQFIIYDAHKVYSSQYQNCLKDFFTIF